MMRWVNQLTATTVIVHTTDGQSLKGVMVGAYRDCIVLEAAEYLAGDTRQPIDGQAVVLRERVSWLQQLRETE